jgi:hypothetical protein
MLLITLIIMTAVAAHAAVSYPLRISADGHHIVDDTGQPVLFKADTPWHIVARLDREDTKAYLDDRRERGFNALLISFLVDDDYRTGTTENVFGEPPFLSPGDFSAPNEAYFAHVDWFLEQAELRGMTVFACPAYIGWQCEHSGFCPEMVAAGPDVMREYARWLGSRYVNQPNLVWVNGGDADAGAWGAMDVVDAVAYGIKETDPVHLHTAHCDRNTISSDCYDRPWLDFETVYSECFATPDYVRQGYQRTPTRPLVYIEGRYEDSVVGATQTCLRSQAYWSLLGGLSGHFFGSSRIWDFPPDWQSALDSQGSVSMEIFGRLIQSRHWDQMVPDYAHHVLTAGHDSIDGADYAAAAYASDGTSILVYTPTSRVLTVQLDVLSGSTAEAWWFDPAQNAAIFEGSFPSTGSRDFTPPSSQDWVLVIDDVGAPLMNIWDDPTVAAPPATVAEVSLRRPAPNPFNPRTTVVFSAPAGQRVTVESFDARGREVAVLFEGRGTGREQSVVWNAEGLASGTYFIRVDSDGRTISRKVAVVK